MYALKVCASVALLTLLYGESAVAQETPTVIRILGTPTNEILAAQTYLFRAGAVHLEGATLYFSIENKPAWATWDPLTGILEGTPTEADVGTYDDIRIAAFNGTDRAALPPFAIRVRSSAATGSISLSWQPPLENRDGSALVDLAGYRIYSGPSEYEFSLLMTISNVGATRYVIESLNPGNHVFAITAVNSQGAESVLSPIAGTVLP